MTSCSIGTLPPEVPLALRHDYLNALGHLLGDRLCRTYGLTAIGFDATSRDSPGDVDPKLFHTLLAELKPGALAAVGCAATAAR